MERRMITPPEIVDDAINIGVKKAKSETMQTVIGGILAGAYIALGGLAAAVASHSVENYGLSKLIAGAVFPVGLMMIIICGGELFTGNTLLLIAHRDGKIPLSKILRNWLIVYFTNMIGAFLVAYFAYASGTFDGNGGKIGGYALKVAAYKAGLPFYKAFISGILCNVLVCLAVWASYAAKDIVSKIFAIWFPIMAFIIGGFEHSVANMYYFSAGLFAKLNPAYAEALNITTDKLDKINAAHIVSNLVPVTLGNIVGGGIFIGLAYYYLYKRPQTKIETFTRAV